MVMKDEFDRLDGDDNLFLDRQELETTISDDVFDHLDVNKNNQIEFEGNCF